MNKIIVLLFIVFLAGCSNGGYTLENPDDFCKKMLIENNPKELKAWLYDGKSTLGEIQTNSESILLANKAYASGAVNIFGVDIEADPEYGNNTGRLVVELPTEKNKRKSLLNWAAPIAHEQGFEAYSDVGQEYIYVSLD
tara:strand:+ start:54 stop:470 length:417 start_codon:yes stop_codon:yes gene_type:complete